MEIYVRSRVVTTETERRIRVIADVTPIGKRKIIRIEKKLTLKEDRAVLTITDQVRNKKVTINIPYQKMVPIE